MTGGRSIGRLTSDAGVGRLEVRHELLGARVIGVQRGVGDGQLAGAPARTAPVEMRQHVRRTSDAAVVLAHAPAEPHPAVASRRHQHHVIGLRRARRVERLPLAVLSAAAAVCTPRHTTSLCLKRGKVSVRNVRTSVTVGVASSVANDVLHNENDVTN